MSDTERQPDLLTRLRATSVRAAEVLGDPSERRAQARHAIFSAARRFTPLLGVEEDGLRYVVSTRDEVVSRWTYVLGHWEKRTTEKALAALAAHPAAKRPLAGHAVIEIGANIGTQSVRFLCKQGASRVVCFEPDPDNVRLLRMNLALNDAAELAEVHAMALSDTDGTVEFEINPSNYGDHRVRVEESGGAGDLEEATWQVRSVPAARLDTLIADGRVSVDDAAMVWMDAQGHEAQILDGAHTVLERGVPIFTEMWPYGLRRAGGLERFAGFVRDNFKEFVEIRSQSDSPPTTLPSSAIDEVIADYETIRPHTNAFTDILLVPGA